MRIQHNIMAMNAYRNYNTNTSALAKNLEKLSSGYKINRAGDDAAGLAISEKMRAQITGLNAAQKNVKDGISLVKTAEGAMQEIQDMLNRMDYLATQSANGTYDNDTDRANLQKEVEALKSEINRIADSANFNGIKLLNGSLDSAAEIGGTPKVDAVEKGLEIVETTGGIADVGKKTITHADGAGNNEKTSFAVDLADYKFSGKKGESITVKIGDNEFKITSTDDALGEKDGAWIADTIAKTVAGTAVANTTVTLNGAAYNATTNALTFEDADGNDQAFGVTAADNQLKFEQTAAPTKPGENVDGKMDVVISGDGTAAVKAGWKTGAYTAGVDGDTPDWNDDGTAKITLTIDGTDVDFDTAAIAATTADLTTALTAASGTVGGDAKTINDYLTVTKNADNTYSLTVKDGLKKADGTDLTVTVKAFAFTPDTGASDDGTGTAGTEPTMGAGAKVDAAAAGVAGSGGSYNVQTINVKNGTAKSDPVLASTIVKLSDDMIVKDAKLKIGDQTITLSDADSDKNTPVAADKIYIGDLKKADGTIDMDLFTERLSQATANNKVWTVSAKASAAGITLVEKTEADGTPTGNDEAKKLDALKDKKLDLTTVDGIKATLGYVTAAQDAVKGEAGNSLVLQIGDTSDAFNQMKINIGSMKTDAMGLDFTMSTKDGITVYNKGTQGPDAIAAGTAPSTQTIAEIDISTRDGASSAINTIKNAINYVSGIRGDLGALQNRLEHTGNNLSVMAENIQDAESTIRDTDVAEEMMKYTKNNILVQSAQAMLAQANAVPQGVLQLLG